MADAKKNRPAGGRAVPKSKARRPADTRKGTAQGRRDHETSAGLNDYEGLEEGRRRRDRGVRVVRTATTADGWRLLVNRAVADLAAQGVPFTAEDVRGLAGEPPGSSPNALGAAMHAASRAGLIEQVGYQQATRPEAHAHVLRVWKGVGR